MIDEDLTEAFEWRHIAKPSIDLALNDRAIEMIDRLASAAKRLVNSEELSRGSFPEWPMGTPVYAWQGALRSPNPVLAYYQELEAEGTYKVAFPQIGGRTFEYGHFDNVDPIAEWVKEKT